MFFKQSLIPTRKCHFDNETSEKNEREMTYLDIKLAKWNRNLLLNQLHEWFFPFNDVTMSYITCPAGDRHTQILSHATTSNTTWLKKEEKQPKRSSD